MGKIGKILDDLLGRFSMELPEEFNEDSFQNINHTKKDLTAGQLETYERIRNDPANSGCSDDALLSAAILGVDPHSFSE